MSINKVESTLHVVEYGRGDSFTIPVTLKTKDGPIDITGHTFKFTVNSEVSPDTTDNQVFTISGSIIDAESGVVGFTPSTTNTNIEPGTYFYDIEMTNPSGEKRTLIIAEFKIIQDLSK